MRGLAVKLLAAETVSCQTLSAAADWRNRRQPGGDGYTKLKAAA